LAAVQLWKIWNCLWVHRLRDKVVSVFVRFSCAASTKERCVREQAVLGFLRSVSVYGKSKRNQSDGYEACEV
jgi:hypothetical protein